MKPLRILVIMSAVWLFHQKGNLTRIEAQTYSCTNFYTSLTAYGCNATNCGSNTDAYEDTQYPDGTQGIQSSSFTTDAGGCGIPIPPALNCHICWEHSRRRKLPTSSGLPV